MLPCPNQNPAATIASTDAIFKIVKRNLHAPAQSHAQVIDECEKRDRRHRQRLRPSEFEIVRFA